jgi:hypothetical protein
MGCSAAHQRMCAIDVENRDDAQDLGVVAHAGSSYEALFRLSLQLTFGLESLRSH